MYDCKHQNSRGRFLHGVTLRSTSALVGRDSFPRFLARTIRYGGHPCSDRLRHEQYRNYSEIHEIEGFFAVS